MIAYSKSVQDEKVFEAMVQSMVSYLHNISCNKKKGTFNALDTRDIQINIFLISVGKHL